MFKSPVIKINEQGIDIIKNHQTERHIEFDEIQQIEYVKGHQLNNWWLFLLLGLIVVVLSIITGVHVAMTYDMHDFPTMFTRILLAIKVFIPWGLFIAGLLWSYLALQTCTFIVIRISDNSYRIRLKEFEKGGKLEDLIRYLSERIREVKS